MFKQNNIEDDLRENLLLYTTPPPDLGPNIFQAHRELSLVRFALSQQFNFYYHSVQILTNLLETVGNDTTQLSNIMNCIANVEMRSAKLIDSAQKVISLIGQVANLDVDKAALRTLVVNLPALVEESIESCTQDKSLASRISCNLSQKIDSLMTVLRFDEQQQLSGPAPQIMQEQYLELMNSVPSQPQ